METRTESRLVTASVKMRRELTQSRYGIDSLMRLYVNTPVSDYFAPGALLGGYVSLDQLDDMDRDSKHLMKQNDFV